jgi:preprotein translocase subunit SecF
MKSRLYLFTFILVALVVIGFGYAGMTLSLDYMQTKYIELQLDINKRQAQNMAAFLESQLQKGSSKKEVRENFQQALEGTNAEKGFLCMFDKYDAEMICHPDENQIGMKTSCRIAV